MSEHAENALRNNDVRRAEREAGFAEGKTVGFAEGFTARGEEAGKASGRQHHEEVDAPLTLADVRKMTTDQINARWSEVQSVLERSR